MSDIAADKEVLFDAMTVFADTHSKDELAKMLSRTLIGIAYSEGAEEARFDGDAGTVLVRCTPIPESAKS